MHGPHLEASDGLAYDRRVSNKRPILATDEIRPRVLRIVAEACGTDISELSPDLRLIQDLHIDSLGWVEMLMALEDEFGIAIPDDGSDPVAASLFVTAEVRIANLIELVYLRQGMGSRVPSGWFRFRRDPAPTPTEAAPFTQLDGKYLGKPGDAWLDPIETRHGIATTIRRRTDGMVCIRIPADEVEFERDGKRIGKSLEAFYLDIEPVSTNAYCRFLNSIGPVAERLLAEWFVSPGSDKRAGHQLIRYDGFRWHPLTGVERWPMVLVSWYGANAYALWASGRDWYGYRTADPDGTFSGLPTEEQFEYAARGATIRRFPWGDEEATLQKAWFGRHERGRDYPTPQSLPIVPVNRPLGLSPFGLRHLAGNVWQWCGNELSAGIRAERGGSWVGPAFLCESGYRRGRVPDARGRCLGFRVAIPT